MSRRVKMRQAVMPWAGLIGGVLGLALAHQIGSDWIIGDCPDSTPAPVILAAVLGVLLIGAGAFGSWTVWSRKGEEPPRRLVAAVSLGLCALLLMAVLLPVIASVVIPTCFA